MIKIIIDHCVLTSTDDPEAKAYVEKPGVVTISSSRINFDDFIIRCNSGKDAAFAVMNWLAHVIEQGANGLIQK